MKNILLAILLGLFSVFAHAAQVNGTLTVKRLFTTTGGLAGFTAVEGLPGECLYGIMYIDLTQPSGDARFAQLLTAKTAGHKIVRLDYTIEPNQQCFVLRLFTE